MQRLPILKMANLMFLHPTPLFGLSTKEYLWYELCPDFLNFLM